GHAAGQFFVAKLTADGELDTSFGVDGIRTISFGGADVVTTVQLQDDGAIVVAGTADDGFDANFAVARLLPDGRLDPTFGAGGMATVAFGGDDRAGDMVLLPDGSIVIVGDTAQTRTSRRTFAVA